MKYIKLFENNSYHTYNKDIIEDISIDIIDNGWEVTKFELVFFDDENGKYSYNKLAKSGSIPGYKITFNSNKYIPDFYSSQEMKNWSDNNVKNEKMIISVAKKLELQIGPIKIDWDINKVTFLIKEKNKLNISSNEENFLKFKSLLNTFLEYSFYYYEYDKSINGNIINFKFKNGKRNNGEDIPFSEYRFRTFIKRLNYLSNPTLSVRRKSVIPISHEYYYGDLDKYDFNIVGSFKDKKATIEYKGLRKK